MKGVRGALLALALILQTSLAFGAETVKFHAVGDVLLDRSVREAIEQHDVHYPFQKVGELIRSGDLAFCNLETPLSKNGAPLNKQFVFGGEPSYIEGLKSAGFDVVSVANNHTLDYGIQAFLDTIETIGSSGLRPAGWVANQNKAPLPVIVERKGLRFALFAYNTFTQEGITLSEDDPGPAQVEAGEAFPEISAAEGKVDFIIASFHWGLDEQSQPTERQVALARKAIDAGADLVLGHHPHVLQPVEFYKGKLILYSLGNFVFDNQSIEQRQSVIFGCEFEKGKILRPYFIPVIINGVRPGIAGGEDYNVIYYRLNSLSFGSNVKLVSTREKIFINEYNGATASPRRYELKDRAIVVHPSRVVLADGSGKTLDSLDIDDPSRHIKESILIEEEGTARLYVIFGSENEVTGGKVGIIPLDTSAGKIGTPLIDGHDGINPWKVMACDVDGDGKSEICVGAWKKTRFDDSYDNRLFVYSTEGDYIYPKWLGSRLALPFVDFTFQDTDGDGTGELVTLEVSADGLKRLMTYQWNGFGFTAFKALEAPSDRNDLSGLIN